MEKGDQVRFLNSTGGGIVKAFQGKDVVLVEDESGFDFPVKITECVVVSRSNRLLSTGPAPEKEKPVAVEQEKPREEIVPIETPEGNRLNIYLAYLPIDPKAIMQSSYEAYLINDSNYYLYFNYMSCRNQSWTSRCNGMIEPHTKIFMEEIPKKELTGLEHLCIQLIAWKKDKPFTLKNAFSVELRPDTVKFYKTHCFVENDFFDEDALLFPVVKEDLPEQQLLVSAVAIREALLEKQRNERSRPPSPGRKAGKTPPPVVEVDLHSHQLLDRTNGMSASEILNYQLDKFHEVMKQYAGKKGQAIVFIHGKGEGVLRKAIEKELKTKYKSCPYQDASFMEYGFGATLVKIR